MQRELDTIERIVALDDAPAAAVKAVTKLIDVDEFLKIQEYVDKQRGSSPPPHRTGAMWLREIDEAARHLKMFHIVDYMERIMAKDSLLLMEVCLEDC